NVLSAGVGEHGAEFGEGDAGAQRNHSTEHPRQKKQGWIRQRPRNIFGGKKNGRADDAAHQQQYGVEQAEPTDETRFFTGRFGFGRQGIGMGFHFGALASFLIPWPVRRKTRAAFRSGGR